MHFRQGNGYLQSVLEEFRVSTESQVVVFSPTSFHGTRVTADTPRAIYFNDDIAVGWVDGSSLIEAAAVDPQKGLAFYTLDQTLNGTPRFREDASCLSCHRSDLTSGIPGLLVLSTWTSRDSGMSHSAFTDQRTPLRERWGGWYVTGLSNRFRHHGNRIGQGWLKSLYDQFYTTGYLTEFSDIVALMVLEHQARATNLMNRLALQSRQTSAFDKEVPDATRDLADYLLFADEAKLPGRIIGTSGFAEKFADVGPRDSKGRSLRQFDLSTRLMRYPCSYMLYSTAFSNLPPAIRTAVYTRIWRILSGQLEQERFAGLSRPDRKAIAEILRDTKNDLPPFFNPAQI